MCIVQACIKIIGYSVLNILCTQCLSRKFLKRLLFGVPAINISANAINTAGTEVKLVKQNAPVTN